MLGLSDTGLLSEYFEDSMSDGCGTLVEDGDLDYFERDSRKRLRDGLKKNPIHLKYKIKREYSDLLQCANKSIGLGTVVVVQL